MTEVEVVYTLTVEEIIEGPGLPEKCHRELKTGCNYCLKCGQKNELPENPQIHLKNGFYSSTDSPVFRM